MLMMVVAEIVLFLLHRPWKQKMIALLIVGIVEVIVLGAYQFHCSLIQSVPEKEQGSLTTIQGWHVADSIVLNEEESEKIMDYWNT